MKYRFLLLLALIMDVLSAQSVDSFAIKQVDSLIQLSRSLTAQQDFDKALIVNTAAEKIAAEKFGLESAVYGSTSFNRGRVNYFRGDFAEAEKWYLLSKTIRESVIGKEHPQYAWSLHNLGFLYFKMGNYEKSEPFYLEAKSIWEKALGKENSDYSSCVNNLANLYKDMSNYEKAEPLYLESKAIREKIFGKEHPSYAQSLDNLANLYTEMGHFEKVEPLYLEAKAIREKSFGKEHPEYAKTLGNIALLYIEMGKYENAKLVLLESKAILEKVLGRDHLDYITCLGNLATLYFRMGNYEKAEDQFLHNNLILKKLLGKEHPAYASSLNNLGYLYCKLGNYEKAEPFFLEGKAIKAKSLGKEHPDYATSLNNLAWLYKDMGRYEKAEPLYLEGKAIREKSLGKEHPEYAASIMSLANLYTEMGSYERAETIYLEAKTILEKLFGKEHPDYGSSLTSLAFVYSSMGDYKKAEQLYIEAKVIAEKVLGNEHPGYAASLNNLAALYINIENYEKAEPLLILGKSILKKSLGIQHPDYASSLVNLGMLYSEMGNYMKAEHVYLEAKEILKNSLGNEHPLYAHNLNNLAKLYAKNRRYTESEILLSECIALGNAKLQKSTSYLSERELSSYKAVFEYENGVIAGIALKRQKTETSPSSSLLPFLLYDQVLFQKGFLLQAASQLKGLVSDNLELQEVNFRLSGYRRLLAAEYSKPISERKGIVDLEEKANSTEKELARSVVGYSEAIQQSKWQDVQANLTTGEAAIEYISFNVSFPTKSDSTIYAALLLKPGDKQPLFVSLFEEKQLIEILSKNKGAESITQLYASRGATPISSESLQGLYDLMWKPLNNLLQNVKTIYYSPSGLLHRINFDAIPISGKENLSDQFKLVRLGSTRSLVVPDLTNADSNNQVLLFGGINYNIDTTLIGIDTISTDLLSSKDDELSFSYAARGIKERGGEWAYLPGTEREINGVSKFFRKSNFKIAHFSGKYATEEAFKNIGKSISSPRVLHLSTHGFFFPDPKSTSRSSVTSSEEDQIFKMSDHPMIRSGLILAGGNYAWKAGKPFKEGMEDGILTAFEISQMNLSNTELVVLSACETGLGDIQGNEGVYGLQRAFKIAGAKYLMMSLWQVPDEETKEFMISFYKNWLQEKLSIPDAFRLTQKQMRTKYSNPYLWAGFVLVE